ncbi:MAG: glycosyltransferase family 2 protein [Candidatus Aenigmarchaeota archaeon]|nr:glycosyltransferase family 2 protein [Candidatus Aenigmarchaeota archaeon]
MLGNVLFGALYYILIYVTLFISVFWFMIFFDKRDRMTKDPANLKRTPGLTMIVPAYNEEKTLGRTVESVLNQDYPRNKLKVIIVDDASTDGTADVGREYARKYPNVTFLRHRKNRRKAAATNTGLRHVTTELVGFIDADTILEESDALIRSIGYFRNKRTGSVIATIKPMDTKTFSQKLQRIEYTFTALVRKLLTFLGALYMTPAFALYRTNLVRQLGGWDEDNFTEDLEMGLKLQNSGYKIEMSMNAAVKTNTPASFSKFWNQRIRWARGFVYNSRKYTHMFFGKSFGHLGWFVLPTQYLVILLAIPVFIYGFFDALNSAYKAVVNYSLIGFDIPYILTHPISMNFNFFNLSLFLVTLVALAALIKLGSKQINEKINKFEYILYIPLYPVVNIMVWMCVFYHEIRRSEYKW